MNRARFLIIVACLAACTPMFGQAVSILDDSPAGSPVSLSGKIVFGKGPDDVTCSLSGRNETPKTIITTAVELKVTAPSGQPGDFMFDEDHFFSNPLVRPSQAKFDVVSETASDCRMVHELDLERNPSPPEAHATLLFVQYLDGSVWTNGKRGSDIGVELVTERIEVLKFLQSLKGTYSLKGLTGLQDALAIDQKPGTMVFSKQSGLRMVEKVSGMQGVADTIDKDLATAEDRRAAVFFNGVTAP